MYMDLSKLDIANITKEEVKHYFPLVCGLSAGLFSLLKPKPSFGSVGKGLLMGIGFGVVAVYAVSELSKKISSTGSSADNKMSKKYADEIAGKIYALDQKYIQCFEGKIEGCNGEEIISELEAYQKVLKDAGYKFQYTDTGGMAVKLTPEEMQTNEVAPMFQVFDVVEPDNHLPQ